MVKENLILGISGPAEVLSRKARGLIAVLHRSFVALWMVTVVGVVRQKRGHGGGTLLSGRRCWRLDGEGLAEGQEDQSRGWCGVGLAPITRPVCWVSLCVCEPSVACPLLDCKQL